MQIGEIARQSGVGIDTIRFYEKRRLLTENVHFQRTESRYRMYDESALEQLRLIKGAQAAGFTLSEIVNLLDRWQVNHLSDNEVVWHLQTKHKEIAAKIADLQRMQCYLEDKLATLTGHVPTSFATSTINNL